jgi:hypothetical protein
LRAWGEGTGVARGGTGVIIISIPDACLITGAWLPRLVIADIKTNILVRLYLFAHLVLRAALICLRITGFIPLTSKKPHEKKQ